MGEAKKRYLVTGALGCIGAWTLFHLVQSGQRVVSFDLSTERQRLDALLPAKEQEVIFFVRGDLTDFDQIQAAIREHDVNRIIHLAALQIPFCRANPVRGAMVNVQGTVNVFEVARQLGIKHLTYASSIAVYGRPAEYPPGLIAHDASTNPHTLYGVYKVANEGTARVYWRDYGVSSLGLRPYTVYGVGRDQGLTSDPTKAIQAALRGEPFEIGFSGEMQFQLASDVARQFIAAADQTGFGQATAFNLGTPVASVGDFIGHIQALRPTAQIIQKESPLPFPAGFAGDALRQAVPRVYETPLAEGIAQTMAHFERLA